MKYFYDTEFLEGTQKRRVLGFELPKMFDAKPTIDLISIGIVSDDGREYYAISKDFNLKEAWNRFQMKETSPAKKYMGFYEEREYWLRENVLKPIFYELSGKDINFHEIDKYFTFSNFKKLILRYGKSNKQIAKEVKNFCYYDKETRDGGGQFASGSFIPNKYPNIDLYGYYSAYDHVVLCWLFGKMIDLPKGFPMFTIDLKQMMDEKANWIIKNDNVFISNGFSKIEEAITLLKNHPNYPKQTNEHNALADAKWNKKLYHFLNSL